MSIQNMMGKYKGRRVAHVIDKTLGAELHVIFGRLPKYRPSLGTTISLSEFKRWCAKYGAKKVEIYPEP